MDDLQLDDFIAQYVGMWHEPDSERRRDVIGRLWAEDAENYTSKSVARGIVEITARVTRAHEQWVAEKGFVFRSAGNTGTHHNLVKFFWEMLPKSGGNIEARGLDIFVLQDDSRIRTLYQFSEPNPA